MLIEKGTGNVFINNSLSIGAGAIIPGSLLTLQASSTTAPALEINQGAIKVTGAGVGTNTPVFIHQATPGNISLNSTTIDHPLTNGDPNAILIITPNWNPGEVGGTYNAHSIGVFYSGGKWIIFNQDSVAMPVNAAFNVLVVKP